MKLTIIIVNYKTPDLVLQCLQSVENTTMVSHEIIVVDNNSEDDSKDIILKEHPTVNWIQMSYNAGFSRANNAGIKVSSGKYILLLNSDTVIQPNAIDVAIKNMEIEEDVVASSVQLLNADKSFQNAGNYFVPGGANVLLTLPIINVALKFIGNMLNFKKPSVISASSKNYVDWISGAFMLVKKSAIDKAGLMDEDFFLFAEEIEWCSRLRKIGKIAVYADVSVIHLEGGTTNKMNTVKPVSYYEYWTPKGYQLMLSNLLRIRKQFSVWWMLIIYVFYVLEIPILFLATFFSKKYTFSFLKKYSSNVFSILRYIPKMILNKPYFYKVM